MRSKEHNEAHINEKFPGEDSGVVAVDENPVENSNRRAVQVLKTLSSILPLSKYLKCEHIVDLIIKSNRAFIGKDEKLLIDNSPTDINAFAFLYNLQQPTKKIDSPDFFELLIVLQIKEGQVFNSNATTLIRKISPETATKKKWSRDYRNKSVQGFKRLKNRSSNSPAEHSSLKTEAAVTMTKKKRKFSKLRTKQVYRRKNNGSLTTSDEKLLQLMYTKGPAAFGSVQNLRKKTQICNLAK